MSFVIGRTCGSLFCCCWLSLADAGWSASLKGRYSHTHLLHKCKGLKLEMIVHTWSFGFKTRQDLSQLDYQLLVRYQTGKVIKTWDSEKWKCSHVFSFHLKLDRYNLKQYLEEKLWSKDKLSKGKMMQRLFAYS